MINNTIKMSNKKNHKIGITEIAINKVKTIKFEEIPKEEHIIISNLAKMVLEISKENNNSNEVSITYKMGTNIEELEGSIGVQFGNEYEVDPLGNTISYHLIKGQNKKYDIDKNILLLNKTGEEYNKTKSLKKKIEAINKFLKECKKNGIIYKNH